MELANSRPLKVYKVDEAKAQRIASKTNLPIIEIFRRAVHAGLAQVDEELAPVKQLNQ